MAEKCLSTSDNQDHGRLIIHSLPTIETQEMVVPYLSRMVKNVSTQKLARKVTRTRFALSKNIAAKKGERIARNLRDLGAKADFLPHDLEARDSASELEYPPAAEIESLDIVYEQNKPEPTRQPQSENSNKRVITALVVVLLVAVFFVLVWQVYELLTG